MLEEQGVSRREEAVGFENPTEADCEMKIETIKTKVSAGNFMLSTYADQEAADENIDIAEICDAILNGEILERYPDTGRGESCLILGLA